MNGSISTLVNIYLAFWANITFQRTLIHIIFSGFTNCAVFNVVMKISRGARVNEVSSKGTSDAVVGGIVGGCQGPGVGQAPHAVQKEEAGLLEYSPAPHVAQEVSEGAASISLAFPTSHSRQEVAPTVPL